MLIITKTLILKLYLCDKLCCLDFHENIVSQAYNYRLLKIINILGNPSWSTCLCYCIIENLSALQFTLLKYSWIAQFTDFGGWQNFKPLSHRQKYNTKPTLSKCMPKLKIITQNESKIRR